MGRIELLNQFKSIPLDKPTIEWETGLRKFIVQIDIKSDIKSDINK